MDKYEYKVHSEEISNLIDMERYAEAVAIADTIDWRRVKSANMLLKIAALYRINRRNEHSREILMLAYNRYPTNRSVVYSLCELSIELDDVVAAIEYYKQFVKLAPKDMGVFTLRYRILEAQEVSLEERVAILEEMKKRDYQEEWAYELAYLYHRMGLATKCVEECDDIILWFGDGSYVVKAMELKALHAPLSGEQLEKYNSITGFVKSDYGDGYDDGSIYQEEGYPDENYPADGYAPEGYPDENYSADGYAPEGYPDENYINGGYTGEFYVEQVYDENGNPVTPDGYENGGRGDGGNYNDEDYYDENYDEYGSVPYIRQGNIITPLPFVQQDNITPMPFAGVGDMSQYNTINIQKVVAEGLKEVFPNGYDIFAEDREKLNPTMISDESEGDTRIYSKDNVDEAAVGSGGHAVPEPGILDPEFVEPRPQTGRVAQLVTNVSETVPEPDTGAIKKVLVPGKDARFIKADQGIDELRDITERSVEEEQSRMEHNDENVYHERSIMDVDGAAPEHTTGSVKLDDVLVEWERVKQDNAKKRQEELKKNILTQTGKILANFDSSIKGGILDELEHGGEEQRAAAETGVADNTSQGRQEQASDDEFDVAYVSDKSGVVNVVTKAFEDEDEKPEKTEAEIKEEYIAELKRVVTQQLEGDSVSEAPEYCEEENEAGTSEYYEEESETGSPWYYEEESETGSPGYYEEESETGSPEYYEEGPEDQEYYGEEPEDQEYYGEEPEDGEYYGGETENLEDCEESAETGQGWERYQIYDQYEERQLDPEDAESIAEMAKEDALKTQEIKMNTAELSLLSEKIVETTNKEAAGAKREEIREFTPDEQTLFENFAVTKKIKKQIIYALDNITLCAYTGNVIVTGDAGIDTVRMAKNLLKEHQASDANFTGRLAKITGEAFNQRNVKDVFAKLDAGGIIIEKANGMTEETLYEMALNLNQENIGIVVIMEDTKKEITKLLEKQAMIADYFNIRIDLMEMDNNALVAYAKNYALALKYSIDELGTLALYTRIANMQSGNHVVTKDEVRDIIDEAIWKSKKSKVKNLVDVLLARKYDDEDMIVLRERDFM